MILEHLSVLDLGLSGVNRLMGQNPYCIDSNETGAFFHENLESISVKVENLSPVFNDTREMKRKIAKVGYMAEINHFSGL